MTGTRKAVQTVSVVWRSISRKRRHRLAAKAAAGRLAAKAEAERAALEAASDAAVCSRRGEIDTDEPCRSSAHVHMLQGVWRAEGVLADVACLDPTDGAAKLRLVYELYAPKAKPVG